MTNHRPQDATDYAKAKAGWPKTPDGTIDWETVFEAPGTGLVAMLTDVGNHELLYKVTATIIRQLFTRKGDEIEVERFLRELTKIVRFAEKNAEEVDSTREAVIDLLRRIKDGRVRKAAAYASEQKRKAALGEKERRQEQRRENDRKVAFRTRLMLMAGGGLAAVLILGGAVFMLAGSDSTPEAGTDGEPAVAAEDAPGNQAAQAAAGAQTAAIDAAEPAPARKKKREYTPDGYPLGTMAREDLLELGEHVMTLPPMLFSRNVGGGSSRQTFILPVLSIRDPGSWESVCAWAPSLNEAISAVMVRQIPATGTIEPTHFRAAGEVALQLMNQRMGGIYVDDVFLLHDVDRSLVKADAGCAALEPD